MSSVIGSLARNPHHAGRTEYLAQYFFSGLGSAIAAPHQEDSGIDLYCTLADIDPDEHRRLLCAHPFFVQVKSKDAEIEFANQKSIHWLVSLPQPYFLCVVSQKELRIQVYHSLPVFFVTLLRKIPDSLVFDLGDDISWSTGEGWPGRAYDYQNGKIVIAAPVLDLTMQQITGNGDWYQRASEVLKGWLNLSEFNIAMRAVGLPVVRYPDEYETNKPLELADHVNGPVIPGGSYTETYTFDSAEARKRFRGLLKRVCASFLLNGEPDETGDAVAWLLERQLKGEEVPSAQDQYHSALLHYNRKRDRLRRTDRKA